MASTTEKPESFSHWFVKAYPLTPFVCFSIYSLALILILTIGLIRWLVKGVDKKVYLELTEVLLLFVHGTVIVVEMYKNFMEFMEQREPHRSHVNANNFYEPFTNEATTDLEVILVKANWCPSCQEYEKSNVWNDVQDEIYKNVDSSSIKFTTYDIATDDATVISSALKIDSKSIPYVPCIYIRTPEGVFSYKDNIYNVSDMVEVLQSLITKFL